MRDIAVNLGSYRLMVTEAPVVKTREENGVEETVTDREGQVMFVVSLFAKRKGEKGEEIKVTLTQEPDPSIEDGNLVELLNATLSPYSFKNNRGETVSGISFKAAALKPVG